MLVYCHVLILFICLDCVRVLNTVCYLSVLAKWSQGNWLQSEGSLVRLPLETLFFILNVSLVFCSSQLSSHKIKHKHSSRVKYMCIEIDIILNKGPKMPPGAPEYNVPPLWTDRPGRSSWFSDRPEKKNPCICETQCPRW